MKRDRMALVRFIEQRLAWPHDYVRNDCIRYTLGAVEAQFGSSPWPDIDWHDERSARRAIAKMGGIEAGADALFKSIACGDAQFGDLAGVMTAEGDFHLALVAGPVLLAPGERRTERSPRSEMIRAWRAAPAVREKAR